MRISREQVRHLARLARLEFSESEETKIADELARILDYIDCLNELDTRGVEPLSHPHELVNVMRDDSQKESLPQFKALENAPSQQDGFFKVPKVIK